MLKKFTTFLFFAFITFLLFNAQVSFCGTEPLRFSNKIEVHGRIQQHLNHAVERLQSAPLDNTEFVLSDIGFQRQRRFTNYSGDVSGRMLGALNSSAWLVGHEIAFLDSLVKEIPAFQKPDGHFGVEQDLEKQPSQEKDMPILWGNGRMLLAMAEYCRDHNDPALLESARKLGDYIISTRKYFGKAENFTQVGGMYASGFTTCYPSLIDGLAALGEVTGQKKYYDEARHIARLSLLDGEFAHHHSHGRLTAYRGMLDLDRLTGTSEFIGAVTAGCKVIREKYLLPTSGITEIFDLDYPRDEGCSEADWIRVNLLLWRATAETEYLDMAESVLRNHLLGNQFSNGGFGHVTYVNLQHGNQSCTAGKVLHFGTEAYWCCSMHGTQILGDIVRWSVLQSNEAFLVTWLAEVNAQFNLDAQNITIVVHKQYSDSWQVILKAPSQAKTILKLRVPGWADDIRVNGKKREAVNGWADVPCDWTGELRLEVQMPMHVKLAGCSQAEPIKDQPVRVFYGPDMYGLPEAWISKEFWPDKFVPEILIPNQVSNPDQIPVLVKAPDGRLQRSNLVRLSQCPPGGRILLFDAEMIEPDSFQQLANQAEPTAEMGMPAELMFACDGKYEIYMNGQRVFQHAGWDESPRVCVYTKQKENVVVVKTRCKADTSALIGTIQSGNQIMATNPGQVTVLACPKEIPHSWLTDPQQWRQKVEVTDIGGYGDSPWGCGPAQFAGTNARWIKPAQTQPPSEYVEWLFCFVFEIPDKAEASPGNYWQKTDKSVALMNNGKILWQFNYGNDQAKPYFHPVALVDGTVLTDNAPKDHPWHHGLWFSWKFINGVNYWEEDLQTGLAPGATKWDNVKIETRPNGSASITMDLSYLVLDQPPVLTEKRTVDISEPNEAGVYWLDWTSTFTAVADVVRLDRTPLPNEQGGQDFGGYAGLSVRLSQGIQDGGYYSTDGLIQLEKDRYRGKHTGLEFAGRKNDNAFGIAILDHPDNLNAPSPWYCIGSQTMIYLSPAVICYKPQTMAKGDCFTLRYRVLVHPQKYESKRLVKEYEKFIQESQVSKKKEAIK